MSPRGHSLISPWGNGMSKAILEGIRVFETHVKERIRKRRRGGKEYTWIEKIALLPSSFPEEKLVAIPLSDYLELVRRLETTSRNTYREIGHPLDTVVTCRARRAYKDTYIVECSDGRKALVPEQTLQELAQRFQDTIELVG